MIIPIRLKALVEEQEVDGHPFRTGRRGACRVKYAQQALAERTHAKRAHPDWQNEAKKSGPSWSSQTKPSGEAPDDLAERSQMATPYRISEQRSQTEKGRIRIGRTKLKMRKDRTGDFAERSQARVASSN